MKKISALVIVCLVVLIALPNLALAVWWNPFTWFSRQPVEKPRVEDYSPKTAASNPELKAEVSPKSKNTQNIPVKKKEIINNPTTTTPTVAPIVVPVVIEQVPIKTEPQDPSKVAMGILLQNPTYENFRNFCNQAKNLQGYTQKKILNASKDQMVLTTVSLYEEISGCKSLDKGQEFVVYTLPDSSLYLTLKDTDTDLVRETKVIYNDKLNTYSQSAKFVIFFNPLSGSKNPPIGVDQKSVVSVSEYFLNQISINNPKQKSSVQLAKISVTGALMDPLIQLRRLYESK